MHVLLAAAPSTNDLPLWASLLVGIGIGTIVSSLVTLLGQLWQRKHELRLERMRDRQRLRDAKLERLREDIREMMFVVFDLQEAALLAGPASAPGAEKNLAKMANEKFHRSIDRYNLARARLVLDPDGERIAKATAALNRAVSSMQDRVFQRLKGIPAGQAVDRMAELFREESGAINAAVDEVVTEARRLLQEIEERPL